MKAKQKMSNFIVRTLSGAVYLLVILAALLINGTVFTAVVMLFTAVMLLEFINMTAPGLPLKGKIAAIAAALAAIALVYATKALGLPAEYVSLAVLPILCLVALVFADMKVEMRSVSGVFAGLLYIGVPMALSPLLAYRSGSFEGLPILGFFILIWASDIGAYCIGTAFGQKEGSRKLCPAISPLKSWAGFWGGLSVCCIVAAALSFTPLLPYPILHCIGLGVLIHLCCVMGDLFESRWKREAGVKDSGNLIPGHGGLLDRLDSTLAAMPAAAAYLVIFNL